MPPIWVRLVNPTRGMGRRRPSSIWIREFNLTAYNDQAWTESSMVNWCIPFSYVWYPFSLRLGEPTGTAALQQAVMMLQQQQQDNRSGSAHLHSHFNPSASTLLPQPFQYPSLLNPYGTQVQYPLQNSNLFQNIGQFPQLSPNSGNIPWDVLRALFSNHRG